MKGPHSYYIIDDKVYDLKEWIPVHPGGSLWFSRSYGRDISTLIYTYHNNPENCKKILARFETDISVEKALDPWLNVPRFLLPADFNLKRDTLAFDFT
jgi:cytochrome b involved in lipid metabolism